MAPMRRLAKENASMNMTPKKAQTAESMTVRCFKIL
jgi:hypothetical protein